MNIEEIKGFTKNKDAWYHVIVPKNATNDEIIKIQDVFNDSQIDGTFLLTSSDTRIRDITEYMEKHRIKEIKEDK